MANCVFYSERWKLFIELMSGTVNDFLSGFLIFLWCCYDVGFTFLKNSQNLLRNYKVPETKNLHRDINSSIF